MGKGLPLVSYGGNYLKNLENEMKIDRANRKQ